MTLSQKPTVFEIRKELHAIISKVGLGSSVDGEEAGEEAGEEDIDIPVPSFSTESDSEDEDKAQLQSESKKYIPNLEDIVIGEPKDSNDIAAGFRDLREEDKITVSEFKVFAFRLTDQEFDVEIPTQED